MKAILKKCTLVALVLSAVILTGCQSSPFYGQADQVKITHDRKANGDTITECTASARGVNACPDQTIIDMNTSGHTSQYGVEDAQENALKAYCRTNPDHPKCS